MSVKVILRQDVPNLGTAGDIKQVASGYYRNFLLPRGLAVEASKGQIAILESKSAAQAGQVARNRDRAGAIAEQIGAQRVRIAVKVGDQNRIYGSVTNRDIAEALAQQAHIEVDRHKIQLPEALKTIGVHSVPVKLEHGVDSTITVELVPETETSQT